MVDMLDIVNKVVREDCEVNEKEYLDTNEAMAFLGVSRPTLFRLIKLYNIQTFTQVRNINYYRRTDLQAVKDTRSQFRPKSPHLAAAA